MKTRPATTAKDNIMWHFLQHNRRGIPAPDYSHSHMRVVVLITERKPTLPVRFDRVSLP